MRTGFIAKNSQDLHISLYNVTMLPDKSNTVEAKLRSVLFHMGDSTLEALTQPLSAIEKIAMSAINLIGALFSEQFTVKDAIDDLEVGLILLSTTPLKPITASIRLICILPGCLIDPNNTLTNPVLQGIYGLAFLIELFAETVIHAPIESFFSIARSLNDCVPVAVYHRPLPIENV